jgi:hypothetical protein
MMNKNRYYKHLACLLVGAVATINVTRAQEVTKSPAALERMKSENLWSQSSNAGGILWDNPIPYSTFDASYQSYRGNFHRPQQGQKGNNLHFLAEGGVAIKKLYVWGNFEYRNQSTREVLFNSSITDPYRGMPYYTADLNASNWNNQFYDMRFKAALPLGGSLSIGLDGIYQVAQAAKQRDPRTLNRVYSLDLKPGVVFALADAHRVGLNIEYCNLKENSEPSLINASDYQIYYELYGLGTAVENIGTGKVVNYTGDKVGGNLQYNYQQGSIRFLLSGGYSLQVEEAEFSFNTPEKFGTTREKAWDVNALLDLSGEKFSHHLQATYAHAGIDGIQYVKRNTSSEGWQILHSYIRSTYQTETASVDYSLMANRGKEYKWKVGAGARYLTKNDEYLLPHSVKEAENLLVSVNGKALVARSEKLSRRLLLGVEAGYNRNLSGAYSYAGNHADYKIVSELEQQDLNYLISDFYFLGGDITYSQKIKESHQTHLYIKGAVNYRKTGSFEFNHRSSLQISIGCNY